MAIRIFHRDHPTLRLPFISKDARFVVWPGIGAWNANMNYVVLEPGEANVPHIHTLSEDTIFILEGRGDNLRSHPRCSSAVSCRMRGPCTRRG
jgi:hypothetical protein